MVGTVETIEIGRGPITLHKDIVRDKNTQSQWNECLDRMHSLSYMRMLYVLGSGR